MQVNGSMHDLVSARLAQALVKERQQLQQVQGPLYVPTSSFVEPLCCFEY
jgi:hypothetical protein